MEVDHEGLLAGRYLNERVARDVGFIVGLPPVEDGRAPGIFAGGFRLQGDIISPLLYKAHLFVAFVVPVPVHAMGAIGLLEEFPVLSNAEIHHLGAHLPVGGLHGYLAEGIEQFLVGRIPEVAIILACVEWILGGGLCGKVAIFNVDAGTYFIFFT